MATSTPSTPGATLAQQLLEALSAAQHVPLPGARDLPILEGVTLGRGFSGPQENVLLQAIKLLVHSGRVYTYGTTVVLESAAMEGEGHTLTHLRLGGAVEPGAESFLGNLFICEVMTANGPIQFPPPSWFIDLLLRAEPLQQRLPRIRVYSSRPMFDAGFNLCGPGWHAHEGILVHGPEIEVIPFHAAGAGSPVMSRLPHHLHTLLAGFCFRSDADLVNTVAMFLTGLLVNHFIANGKPIVLVDGNQSNIGKTLLIRVIGSVLDGAEPYLLPYRPDEDELQKTLCSKLRKAQRSVLLIDNCKITAGGMVSSPTIESLSVAPEISLRILGLSQDFTRPNDLLWAITMNDTKASADIISRGIPIQMYYEGDTTHRNFQGSEPLTYALQHRLEILGELAGMVLHWTQVGHPAGNQPHRCRYWADIIGGILGAAGFPEFLANAQVATSFNSEADELAAIVEAMIQLGGPVIFET